MHVFLMILVRDEFENKRDELEAQLSKILGGEQWKVEVNQNLIFAYADEGSYGYSNLGGCIFRQVKDIHEWVNN